MLIQQLLDNTAWHPQRNALIYADQQWSWQELNTQVMRLSAGLAAAGIGPGDKVALWLDNSPWFIFSFFAVLSRGAVVAPLNPTLKQGDAKLLQQDFSAIISRPGLAASCRRALKPKLILLCPNQDEECELLKHGKASPEIVPADTAAILQFSSGTTGRPKALYRTHKQCLAEIQHFRTACQITVDDRIFCALPLFHTHGLGNALLAMLGSAASLILMANPQPFALRWLDALNLLERERATVFPGVPEMFDILAQAPQSGTLDSLRLCFSAGSPLPEVTYRAFFKRYAIAVRQLYGCTEAGSVCIELGQDSEAGVGTVGTPMPGVEIDIRDAEGTSLACGQTGDILIRSPATTTGYIGHEEAKQHCFRAGWFATGDIGRLDNNGRLHIAGRKGLMLFIAGHKVYPEEIEAVLQSHPAIVDSAVIALHSEQSLPIIKAFVIACEPLSEEQFFDFCRLRLAAHKRPAQLVFVTTLPKTSSGKTARYLLH